MILDRKDFLKLSATSASALLFSSAETLAQGKAGFVKDQKTFRLKIFATNWGFEGTMEEFCKKARSEGYDGIETVFPGDKNELNRLQKALDEHHLEVGYLVRGSDWNFKKHFDEFKKEVDAAIATKPVFLNCHSGRDIFTYDQNKTFIDYTTEAVNRTGIPIYHETHRSRLLYSATVSREYMDKIKDLKLTFDVSHWCNVHESLLEDQQDTVNLAIERTGHIHTRVGHQEGPQVNDPRAPEWKTALDTHLGWWDTIVEIKKKKGETLTMLTEFGPPQYMPTHPYTNKPLANQWEINVHMLKMLRARYA